MASILVWGDEYDACMLAKRVLDTLHYSVVVFTDYGEAIRWVQKAQPEMAVIDSKKDGVAMMMLEALKKFNPDAHVLITTTDSPSSEHVKKIKALGADVFFSRPIEIGELEKRAQRIFSQKNQVPGGDDLDKSRIPDDFVKCSQAKRANPEE